MSMKRAGRGLLPTYRLKRAGEQVTCESGVNICPRREIFEKFWEAFRDKRAICRQSIIPLKAVHGSHSVFTAAGKRKIAILGPLETLRFQMPPHASLN